MYNVEQYFEDAVIVILDITIPEVTHRNDLHCYSFSHLGNKSAYHTTVETTVDKITKYVHSNFKLTKIYNNSDNNVLLYVNK